MVSEVLVYMHVCKNVVNVRVPMNNWDHCGLRYSCVAFVMTLISLCLLHIIRVAPSIISTCLLEYCGRV